MSDTSDKPGIRTYSAYLPNYLLSTNRFGPATDGGPARAARSVASFDQDAVTLAVEAAGSLGTEHGDSLHFATSEPPYLDKSSAATVHAALRFDPASEAIDLHGLRAGATALSLALATGGTAVAADQRLPAPGAPDELLHGDGAAAFDCGPGEPAAELIGRASLTRELLDRWRLPGETHPNVWDERFTAEVLGELMLEAAAAALADAGIERTDRVVVASANPRATKPVRKALGSDGSDAELEAATGHTGAAHIGLLLADALDRAEPGETILAISAADGADAFVFRVTEAIADARRGNPVREQLAGRTAIPYERFLRWREILVLRGAPRPDPAAPASPPMSRRRDWKYGLVGERCGSCGTVFTPPGPVCPACGTAAGGDPVELSRLDGIVVSLTTDHLAPSVDPPVTLAVVDIEGGGRRSLELTDLPPEGAAIGDRVVPTFRRIFTSEGIHNYFWKAKPAGVN